MANTKRLTGVVKWFNDSRGYGFILNEEGEYFVHWHDVIMKGHKVLEVGDKVSFAVELKDGKAKAVDVLKVEE